MKKKKKKKKKGKKKKKKKKKNAIADAQMYGPDNPCQTKPNQLKNQPGIYTKRKQRAEGNNLLHC